MSRQDLQIADGESIDLRVPAIGPNVTVARQALSGFADAFGWDDAFAGDLRLALSEACTNVVRHAYRDVCEPGDMRVQLLWEGGKLVMAVSDEGNGLGPPAMGGLGLGLPLIRALADDVAISTNPGATCVQMIFTPPVATAADD